MVMVKGSCSSDELQAIVCVSCRTAFSCEEREKRMMMEIKGRR